MSAQNLTLLTDLYELTMMQGYFETQENQTVVFDVFFRDNPNKGGYSVMAGLDQVIDYIKNLNFSYEDVDYLRGLGSVIYKACVAAALKFFEPQDMKLITAVLFLLILVIGGERRKKVKKNARA